MAAYETARGRTVALRLQIRVRARGTPLEALVVGLIREKRSSEGHLEVSSVSHAFLKRGAEGQGRT